MSSKKIYIINGSPRKKQNTAKMCESFKQGAESKGAETEIINLYDIDFKGCRSCFACKLKGGKNFGRCAYPDALTPLLDKITHADGIVFASPIYFLDVTGEIRAFLERLLFPLTQYDFNHSSSAPKRLKTAVIYTMNVTEEFLNNEPWGKKISNSIDGFEQFIGHIFTPPMRICAYDTYQFSDYDKYAAECFDKDKKKKQNEEQFPLDLQKAYNSGVLMADEINKEQ